MRSVFCIMLAATAACSASSGTGDDDDIPASCGNSTPDPGEQCDDGNDNRFDGCRPDCTAVDLPFGDLGRFVGFRVWSEGDAGGRREVLDAADIPEQTLAIDDNLRCRQLGQEHGRSLTSS